MERAQLMVHDTHDCVRADGLVWMGRLGDGWTLRQYSSAWVQYRQGVVVGQVCGCVSLHHARATTRPSIRQRIRELEVRDGRSASIHRQSSNRGCVLGM